MNRHLPAVLSAVAFLLAAKSRSQNVVASQGALNPNEFRSPMALEVPLVVADPARWNDTWTTEKEYTELKAFHCEGVFIERLKLRARKSADQNSVEVTASVKLRNPNGSHDKKVYVALEFQNDGRRVGVFRRVFSTIEASRPTPADGGIKVEESDSATGQFVGDAFVRDVNSGTKLKITVTVKDS